MFSRKSTYAEVRGVTQDGLVKHPIHRKLMSCPSKLSRFRYWSLDFIYFPK